MGSHLQQATHSDANRITSTHPKMILITYKIDAHPVSLWLTAKVIGPAYHVMVRRIVTALLMAVSVLASASVSAVQRAWMLVVAILAAFAAGLASWISIDIKKISTRSARSGTGWMVAYSFYAGVSRVRPNRVPRSSTGRDCSARGGRAR